MRITIISFIATLLLSITSHAQQLAEYPDSIKAKDLGEVSIVASMQNITAKVSSFIPTLKQKNAANDATSLLRIMSSPQLSIDPINNIVKTQSGHPVAVFINFIEASTEDINGLNPKDVKRVEYYITTSDPRFFGKRYVVNFVMQKYEWGGYTKINGTQSLGVMSTDASVYSKMKYKAMNFDFYAGEKYNEIRHAGNETIEDMMFTDLYGNGPANISRMINSSTTATHQTTNDVSFRAIYDRDKVQLNNRISLNYISSPDNETTNDIVYDNNLDRDVTTTSTVSSKNMTARYAGQYLFSLPHNLSLNIDSRFEYGNNRLFSHYNGFENLSITNNAHEKSYSGEVTPALNWQINDNHSVRVYTTGQWQNHKIEYSGNSSSSEIYKIHEYQAGASYDYATEKWSTALNMGWVWQKNSISDYKTHTSYPRINAEVSYSPSDNTQISTSYEFYETIPTASSTSPVILQQDELMSYAGNPDMKNSPTYEIALHGVWLPSNKWQLAFTGFHYNISQRRVSSFLPEGHDGTMLRYYTNNGSYMSTMFGFNVSANLLGGKLSASLNPQVWLRKTTGTFAMSRNEITCTTQLIYYFGNLYALGWYVTPSHYPDENSGIEHKTTSQYSLQVGWGNGYWNIGVEAANFFRSSWRSNKELLRSEYYNMSSLCYSPGQHMKFSLSITYTFGYGKKVGRNDELKGESAASSAILK